jgi:DNA-binding MarR family transcriptional regulator
MDTNRMAIIDTMIPVITPNDGITRTELSKLLKVSYTQATQVLERMRQKRLVKRHIRKSQYIYRLSASRQCLTISVPTTFCLN